MSNTALLRGTQIKPGTVPWSAMTTGAIVPISAIINGDKIILNDGSVDMAAPLNLGGYTVQNSGTPVNSNDLTTKIYVDLKTGGIGGIHSVCVTSATNITLAAPGATIDGVTPVVGDLVLLTGQTVASQNGPWVFEGAAAAMVRPLWWVHASTVNEGQYFLVSEGTTYKNTKWFCTTTGTITVDTTALTFTQDLSGIIYSNGTGLSLTGSSFSVNYGTTAGTAAQGNDSRITGALQTSVLGSNVLTALELGLGSVGAFITNGGQLGTPSGGTLTNCSGLPISGLANLGTGVASALTVNIGSANGIPVLATGGYLAAANSPAYTGDVTSAAGSLNMTVNNTAGTGFTKYTNFINNEVPVGLINGTNTSFTLANTPTNCHGGGSSLMLYLNGDILDNGTGNDFTITGNIITMLYAPQAGDKLRANYML